MNGSRRKRHSLTVLPQRFEMQAHCLLNELLRFLQRVAACDAAWQVGHIRRIRSVRRTFNDRDVFHDPPHFNPACLRILLSVPGATSLPSFPPGGTVTVPAFSGCRNCRWLPTVRSNDQPFRSSNRITSRYFIGMLTGSISHSSLAATAVVRNSSPLTRCAT